MNILDTLKWIILPVNTLCNLRCKDCNSFTPYHKNPRNFNTEDLKRDLDKIFEVFSDFPLERLD